MIQRFASISLGAPYDPAINHPRDDRSYSVLISAPFGNPSARLIPRICPASANTTGIMHSVPCIIATNLICYSRKGWS
jgi:hypothetical protein